MMTTTDLNEAINMVINKAMGNLGARNSPQTTADIATALTNAATAVTALATPGPAPTHSREMQDPGAALNTSLNPF